MFYFLEYVCSLLAVVLFTILIIQDSKHEILDLNSPHCKMYGKVKLEYWSWLVILLDALYKLPFLDKIAFQSLSVF